MVDVPRLEAYHFYEQDWESYEQLQDQFEWEFPKRFNMADYVCDRWAGSDRTAIISNQPSGSKRYTFDQLRLLSNRLANYFVEHGITQGDRVAVNSPQKPETAIAHIAAWKVGALSVPLSTLFGPSALEYRLDDSEAVAIVVDESNLDNFRSIKENIDSLENIITVDADGTEPDEIEFSKALEISSDKFTNASTAPDDEGMIFYTSGTTGDPKGVLHTHALLLGNLTNFVTTTCNMELQAGDVHWNVAEWAWIGSIFCTVFPALYYGKTVVAHQPRGKFDPEIAYELIDKYDVTHFMAAPTGLRMMMQIDDPREVYDLSQVRVIYSGGEAMGENVIQWADDVFDGAAVHEGYGQTEANFVVGSCTELYDRRSGAIGKPVPGHDVTIVDPDTGDSDVGEGDVGEIAVRYEGDPVCFQRYLNKPGKTDKKLKGEWLLTEDLGRMKDGHIYFVGRKDDVIISAGYRIGPEEVEDSLMAHEAVVDAGVIGIPDERRGNVPKAFVTVNESYSESENLINELKEFVKNNLAKYEYPREVEVVDELPKTPTGKIRRKSLRDREGIDK